MLNTGGDGPTAAPHAIQRSPNPGTPLRSGKAPGAAPTPMPRTMLSVGRFICLKPPPPHTAPAGGQQHRGAKIPVLLSPCPLLVSPRSSLGFCPVPALPPLWGRRLLLSLKTRQRIFIYF